MNEYIYLLHPPLRCPMKHLASLPGFCHKIQNEGPHFPWAFWQDKRWTTALLFGFSASLSDPKWENAAIYTNRRGHSAPGLRPKATLLPQPPPLPLTPRRSARTLLEKVEARRGRRRRRRTRKWSRRWPRRRIRPRRARIFVSKKQRFHPQQQDNRQGTESICKVFLELRS
jgi:hypothetical protein